MSTMDKNTIDFSSFGSYYIRISPDGAANPSFEMPAADFLRGEAVMDAIIAGGSAVRPTGHELAASFIGGNLFGLCALRLLFLAQYNAVLDLSLDKMTFQIEHFGTYNLFGFKLGDDYSFTGVPEDAERGDYVQAILEHDLKSVVAPMLNALASAASMKPGIIWIQYGSMLATLMNMVEAKETQSEVLQRFKHDCSVLLERMDTSIFGSNRNPFAHTPRYIDNPYQPGGKMMIRSGCCMYYCREDGDMCYNCPKLTAPERDARRAKIAAASNSA
ncbi:hypothetical protein [Paenibacillus montanisoli]|uniref:Ferric siderophore reductase C-terminal domain-containing protein n=1 Tax=Paenibacillus montanisoli TaxID=2081970 RepID=A0A328U717_9BACL|nr:hypothetical protein [Paenibacillus montanisoli]RAP78320.1 hypothetical protein DL346_07790 [Paenibacillus montanisoli]